MNTLENNRLNRHVLATVMESTEGVEDYRTDVLEVAKVALEKEVAAHNLSANDEIRFMIVISALLKHRREQQ